MTDQGQRVAAVWQDPAFAQAWAEGDAMGDLLAFPRRLAAALVAHDRPRTSLVVDIGSGPGAFLAVFLDEFPEARGVCSDASEAMLDRARDNLAGYGDRVEFRLVDMTDLRPAHHPPSTDAPLDTGHHLRSADAARDPASSAGGVPGGADVIVTSRAAHHLDRAGLAAFYAQAAERLTPGGWLINLDHTGPEDVWDKRFRAVRKRFATPRRTEPTHHHNYPLTSVTDHLTGFEQAGITDVEIAWKAFYTCLFIGRKAG